jgi:hypothetical protein
MGRTATRRISGWLAVALVPLWTGTATAQSDVKERMDAARAAAGDFVMTLLGALQKAIAAGGPASAIGVCNLAAPEIAATKSAERHMTIARTSLRLRQPKNAGMTGNCASCRASSSARRPAKTPPPSKSANMSMSAARSGSAT